MPELTLEPWVAPPHLAYQVMTLHLQSPVNERMEVIVTLKTQWGELLLKGSLPADWIAKCGTDPAWECVVKLDNDDG